MIQEISTVDRLCEFSHESWSGIRQIQIVKAPCTDIQEEKKINKKKMDCNEYVIHKKCIHYVICTEMQRLSS